MLARITLDSVEQFIFFVPDFLMLLSIHTELHRKFLVTFGLDKYIHMTEDLICLPISTDYFIDFMLFLVSSFQWHECRIARSILKGNPEGH